MLDFEGSCKWCDAPIHLDSENPFVMFCLRYYEGEKFMRKYLRKRGRRCYDEVCLRCKNLKFPKMNDRELGRERKMPPAMDTYDYFFEFVSLISEQDTLHHLYKRYMRKNDYMLEPFCDYLEFREFLLGNDWEWVYEDDEVLVWYEKMVRFHLNFPIGLYNCVWDEDDNIISFVPKQTV